MSADSWTTCPRCTERLDETKASEARRLADAYGKVDLEEYEAMKSEIAKVQALTPNENFREDYEFYGAEDGEVTASYGGSCKDCGLKVSFKHSVQFWPEPSAVKP